MICSLPEVKAMIGPERPICARLKFTSKKPFKRLSWLTGEAPPVNVFGSQKSIFDPKRNISGGLFIGVVPDQDVFVPVAVKGLVFPAMA